MRELVEEFKSRYKEKGNDNLKQEEVAFLSELADAYVRRAETLSRKWVELLKVSLIDFYAVDWNYFAPKYICKNAGKP